MDQKVHLEKLAQKPKAGFSEFRFSGVLLLIPGSKSGSSADADADADVDADGEEPKK